MTDNVLITPPSWLVRRGTSIVALIMVILAIGSFYLPCYKMKKGEIVLIKPLEDRAMNQFICNIKIPLNENSYIQIGKKIKIRIEEMQNEKIELIGHICSSNKTNDISLISVEIILTPNQAKLLYGKEEKFNATIIIDKVYLGNIILNSFKSLF